MENDLTHDERAALWADVASSPRAYAALQKLMTLLDNRKKIIDDCVYARGALEDALRSAGWVQAAEMVREAQVQHGPLYREWIGDGAAMNPLKRAAELLLMLRDDDFWEEIGTLAATIDQIADVEPVAWMYDNGTENYFFQRKRQEAALNTKAGWTEHPLYAHPPIPHGERNRGR